VGRQLLPYVPKRVRAGVLRSQRLAPFTRWFVADDAAVWDRWYSTADIEGIESSAREQAKFARTLQAIPDDPAARVLEIGCGPGIFSSMLAGRSGDLLAIDVSSVAVAQARARLAPFPDARAEVGSLPDRLPAGPFDIIVASDVLYYLSPWELGPSLERIESVLAPGGCFIAIHHRRIGMPMTGAEVHDRMRSALALEHDADLGDELIAIDRYRRPARRLVPVMDEDSVRPRARTTIGAIAVGLALAAQHASMEVLAFA
jgi:SAM-dependent methyltransferase